MGPIKSIRWEVSSKDPPKGTSRFPYKSMGKTSAMVPPKSLLRFHHYTNYKDYIYIARLKICASQTHCFIDSILYLPPNQASVCGLNGDAARGLPTPPRLRRWGSAMRAPAGGAFRAPAATAPKEGEREVSGDGEDLGECPAVGDLGDPQPRQKNDKNIQKTRCKMNQNHREVLVAKIGVLGWWVDIMPLYMQLIGKIHDFLS